jgi:hypothetical protein
MNQLVHRVFLLAGLVLAACAAAPSQRMPLPPQDVVVSSPELTRIYFLREGGEAIQARTIKVLEDDREVGELTSDTYLCWERRPGRTIARAFFEAFDPGRGQVEGVANLDCEAGRAHYYNVTLSRGAGKPTVTQLDPEEGRRLVAERKPAGS